MAKRYEPGIRTWYVKSDTLRPPLRRIALNNLGAGGQAKPFLVNASNALTYGLMVVLSPLGGPLVNRIGAKWTLFLGVIL